MTSIELPILTEHSPRASFDTGLRAAAKITTLQINIGYRCNLACRHCHVESSPARTAPGDNMDEATAGKVVDWVLANPDIRTVDITGGSPELNPSFPWMVETFTARGLSVIDRCNPTIIEHVDPDTGEEYAWIPGFLADHRARVVASLPCYTEDNVDHQRGRGSYNASVEGLRKLNAAGYGRDPRLVLNLVYNPDGPHLPPAQSDLEADYKRELKNRFGLVFNELWTITNMPIGRWRRELARDGRLDAYLELLVRSHNPSTVDGLMCRHQISIDPQGRLYDCDFNQALRLPAPGRENRRLWECTAPDLAQRRIATADHCYGCTAGAGSSCGGAIA
ncbi:MAG: arsenosugar biosynthesis radical SAM protein ArsS [Planctomycetota bacterium]|nr:arsenosugar biosynthesis radical SAM protein ArsS [Planctomycetota bacterium]